MYSDVVYLLPDHTQIYADVSSVKRSEYYAALQAGTQADVVFTIRSFDYRNEKELEFEGDIYNIIRTYEKTKDDIEIICQRAEREPVLHNWELNATAALYKLVTTPTAAGGDMQVPTLVADTIAVKVETISGREYTEQRRQKAELTHKITLAYRNDINQSMYFVYNGRKLV
ncbi:MAG: phage head closure protein, partial [Clostridiales bacterium]